MCKRNRDANQTNEQMFRLRTSPRYYSSDKSSNAGHTKIVAWLMVDLCVSVCQTLLLNFNRPTRWGMEFALLHRWYWQWIERKSARQSNSVCFSSFKSYKRRSSSWRENVIILSDSFPMQTTKALSDLFLSLLFLIDAFIRRWLRTFDFRCVNQTRHSVQCDS